MTTAALIAAANPSRRAEAFRPMGHVGAISVAQRVVSTFRQAGIERIVMVTGCNASELERHLAGGVIFLRNENYAATEMFDSVRIGLTYLQGKCDRLLITPVDIPLFTAATAETLLAAKAPLVRPTYRGRPGHPIALDAALIATLLADGGEDGLRGALRRCGVQPLDVPVEDEGVVRVSDEPEGYRELLRRHNAQLIRPEVSVALAREKTFFDGRSAMLLRLVEETGSVRLACRRMQLSYSGGWNVIRALESQLSRPLLERSPGGAGGGGSALTEDGRRLLRQYDGYTAALRAAAAELYRQYFDERWEEPPAEPDAPRREEAT